MDVSAQRPVRRTETAFDARRSVISKSEIRFAARLVHLGLVSKEDMESVLADLNSSRDRRLDSSLDDILVERGHITKTEIPLIREEAQPSIAGFTIEKMIGEGGMSRVYRARPDGRAPRVALKILRPHIVRNAVQVERFYDEARMLMRFDHPNIVKGHDVWEADGLHCFSMELVDGQSILEEIDTGPRFSEDEALSVVLQSARALDYLSKQGITHRDVKPGNVLLGSGGEVKLIDLGLACGGSAGSAEPAETTVGTVQYLSPEQAQGEALDVRADIYSLGVTFYHMVTGELPFEGEDDRDVLRQQIYASLRSPRMKNRDISPLVHYFIEKMMAKDRTLRYANATEMIADIEERIAGREEILSARARLQGPAPTVTPAPTKPAPRRPAPRGGSRFDRRRRGGRFGR